MASISPSEICSSGICPAPGPPAEPAYAGEMNAVGVRIDWATYSSADIPATRSPAHDGASARDGPAGTIPLLSGPSWQPAQPFHRNNWAPSSAEVGVPLSGRAAAAANEVDAATAAAAAYHADRGITRRQLPTSCGCACSST